MDIAKGPGFLFVVATRHDTGAKQRSQVRGGGVEREKGKMNLILLRPRIGQDRIFRETYDSNSIQLFLFSTFFQEGEKGNRNRYRNLATQHDGGRGRTKRELTAARH